ncbi:alcohol dehydrogenase catalytic domain-containing protein [Streptomyces sp. B6B3]|uniref:alcohol dehydrogenase catalytic domain-containing protein n=1 Tax=Streptomyces sp. B6B3 TaxID=3153570 RepID=UPI00325E4DCD
MKALVYHGPGRPSWDDVDDPTVQDPGDAIVRVDTTTICGTDLHILKGDVPEVTPGTILGHEAVATVVETGSEVRTVRPGDRVLVSCISACGRCSYCRQAAYGQCLGGGGWILGHLVNGAQAEYLRVPFADLSTHPLPETLDPKDAVLLSDIFPTAYEVGVHNGGVRPGDTVVIVGAGPIGLAAVATARLLSPGRIIVFDPAKDRLEAARALGADVIGDPHENPEALVADLTGGLGAEVTIEAVGLAETFELCARLVRAGGRVANVGVHGGPATLHLEDLWIRNITITTGLVDTHSTHTLLSLLADGRLPASDLVTHTFPLDQIERAYQVFADPGTTGALKVALTTRPTNNGELIPTGG